MRQFKPQELSNLVWSFAKVSLPAKELFESVARTSMCKIGCFSFQNLSNLAWAFATTGICDTVLFERIATQSDAGITGFSSQELSNIAWAFATLEVRHDVLLQAIGAELTSRVGACEPARLPRATATELAKNSLGAVWALKFAGCLSWGVATSVGRFLRLVGSSLDTCSARAWPIPRHQRDAPLHSSPERPETHAIEDHAVPSPRLVLDLHDRAVIFKPEGWQVDQGKAEGTEKNGDARRLSGFLRQAAPWQDLPIVCDAEHGRGFLHRLDAPCAGLVLVAKTYEAYYDLQFQLVTGEVVRDYLVLSHGAVSPERRVINARVYWTATSNQRSTVEQQGKPALSRVKVLAHVARGEAAYSLLALRIDTGRRHQIRAHVAHVGHPAVCDGKYNDFHKFVEDRHWCPHTFLHRYRLAFKDRGGDVREVMWPLPRGLVGALATLSASDEQSKRVLADWVAGVGCRSWDEYPILGKGASST